jgi:hypothetical protein
MRLQNPNVPDWTVEVTDKEEIQAHLDAGWLQMPTKRRSAKKVESATKTQVTEQNESSDAKAEE